ncbi:MAG TPA: FkbM family methyltransferase, partial [Verrucomicrobiae bacterium]|nr:FkbM family methyltransferase [Verrucomicrobiae bacterium]
MAYGLMTVQAGASSEAVALFEVSLAAYPWLNDHGFHDLMVLPGSFYIELALRKHRELSDPPARRVKKAAFLQPVLLSDRKIGLSVYIRRLGGEAIEYTFREEAEPNVDTGEAPACAIIEVECREGNHGIPGVESFPPDSFRQTAAHFSQADFYRRLRENGNQYGPQFKGLADVWRSNEEALGRLRVHRNAPGTDEEVLNAILTDGIIQLMSSFRLEGGRTFILQGIEEIALPQTELPDKVWVYARIREEAGARADGGVGDLVVYDDAGTPLMSLRGVRFANMDRPKAALGAKPAKIKVVLASNFTVDPVQDSLEFWGDYLGLPVDVSIAPYDQVIQELLNSSSQLRQNGSGFNAILLNLGDWAPASRPTALNGDIEQIRAALGDLSRHTLPNGLEIAHLNPYETRYVYQEIFEDRCYLRHGIRLSENAVVIDIGANIGLFSLFVRDRCPAASIYSFEPNPVAFQALKANSEAYGPGLFPFNAGVSERRGSASLTFYEKSSVFSGFHPDEEDDRQAIKAVIENMVRGELGNGEEPVAEFAEELMKDRLNQRTFECQLVSVSDIIREQGLARVNLLKVDAEKCELEILRGVEAGHWSMIDQVVVEVHDRTGRLVTEVQEILTKQGFRCAVVEEKFLQRSGLFNVYATRPENDTPEPPEPDAYELLAGTLNAKADQLVQALEVFSRSDAGSAVLCFCLPVMKGARGVALEPALAACEERLATLLDEIPRIEVIRSGTIQTRYPEVEFPDPHSNEQGHLPYTPEGFAVVGSSLFRTLAGQRSLPRKMVVLDCDNTLWQGACGEEGPLGVKVDPAHREFQNFLVRQMSAGMLLCLCSKNSESDVWSVFAQNPGMVLRREHIVAARINWAPKSENLRSLASELNVGLDSVLFLDDNPVECAEVRANSPEVLALQIPEDLTRLPRFLAHIWAFDRATATEEDRARTRMVLENARRDEYRGQSATLSDFIDGLQLRVTLLEPSRDQLGRVSQLTQRTNQFNFTTVRRTEDEIARFLEQEGGRCLVAKVNDRFGDYGVVGLLLYQTNGDRWEVDTFLLSCRVLGRGVEHQILSQFARLALEDERSWVNLQFRPTEKNQPAWVFIQSVGAEWASPHDGGASFLMPAAKLAELRYHPESLSTGQPVPRMAEEGSGGPAPNRNVNLPAIGRSEIFQRVAGELSEGKSLVAAIASRRWRLAGGDTAPTSEDFSGTLPEKMLGIWRRAIGNPRMGMDDNFVEAGGTSLKAVQIVAAIRRELRRQLPIVSIFECPTVRLL